MGIPTGSPQGGNSGGGGLPTGRTPGSQQPAQQPRQRPAGLPQPDRETPQRPAPQQGGQSSQPQRRPVQQSPSRGLPTPANESAQAPLRRQTPPQQVPREIPQEELPLVPEDDFNDSFEGFDESTDDLFSDVPEKYREEPFQGELDNLDDDDPFSPAAGYEDEDEEQEELEPEPTPVPQRQSQKSAPAARPRRLQGNSRAPERSRAADEEFSEDFVDKKNLKLKPFGKSKKKAKVGDFDQRKNLEGQRKLYRTIFLVAIVAIVGFGAYQTFWPQKSLSVAEVENIAALQAGQTGFPTTRGEGFALSFMDSLLNVQPGDADEAKRTAALSYFYGASGDSKSFDSALTAVGNIDQQIVYGPVVLDSTALTDSAASYEIGVLLSTTDSQAPEQQGTAQVEATSDSLRWVAFNVNVYHDAKKDSFAIAPNSPSLIPAPAVEAPSSVPDGEPLGEVVDDVPESVKATVVGFLSGYRESSKTNYDKILQYIGADADESLRNGLDSRYQFATPDDPASSIDMDVYRTGDTLGELKILLTVDWQISAGSESSVTFPSHYVLTLTSSGSGNYTVAKFAPYYWVKATDQG